jgi:hypothetical protein
MPPRRRDGGSPLRFVIVMLLAAILTVAGPTVPRSSAVAFAQEIPEMPALGAVVLENALTAEGTFRERQCPTSRSSATFGEAGLEMTVTGRCTDTATGAGVGTAATGLTAANGEFSVEVKLVEGYDRGLVAVSFREQSNGNYYIVSLTPSRKGIEVRKSVGSIFATIAQRTDIESMPPDAWTRIGVRLEGERFWILVGDQPVLSGTDSTLARGGFGIGLVRVGSVDDDTPVTAIWRNVRVSALAREPAASTAPPAPAGAQAAFTPAAGEPPTVGRRVVEDALSARGIIPTGTCNTGRGRGEVVGEGFLLSVSGRCTEAATTAFVAPTLSGLTVPDGEIRFEVKVVNGFERASLTIGARRSIDPSGAYGFNVRPATGTAGIVKTEAGQPIKILAQRADIGQLFLRDDWNVMAIRMHGSSLWLFLNDRPLLTVEDGAYQAGAVVLELARLGDPNDDAEVAVVYRNLSVSAIEGAPDDRAPSYQVPPRRPAGSGPALSRWVMGD